MATTSTRRSFTADDNLRAHVVEAGSGPRKLIFFPAVGDMALSYEPVLLKLAQELEDHTLIAVDPPGYGRAVLKGGAIPTFSVLMTWAQRFLPGDGPVTLIGNSSGGAMATAAAVAAGSRCMGLILMGWPDWRVAQMPLKALVPGDTDELSQLLARAWHTMPQVKPHMAEILLQRYLSEAFRAHVYSLNPDEVLEYYDAYQGPLLFLGGQSDDLVPVAALESSAARRPGAGLQVIRACGHFPHRERPEALIEQVLGFVRSL